MVRQMTAIKALVQRISAFLDYGDVAKTFVIHILSNAGVFEFIVGIIFSFPNRWPDKRFNLRGLGSFFIPCHFLDFFVS